VVCLAPRALEDIVRPRRPLGRIGTDSRASFDVSAACDIGRPLNFTVRSHFGTSSSAKSRKSSSSFDSAVISAATRSIVQPASSFDASACARAAAASIDLGARAVHAGTRTGTKRIHVIHMGALNVDIVSRSLAATGAHAHSGGCEGDF